MWTLWRKNVLEERIFASDSYFSTCYHITTDFIDKKNGENSAGYVAQNIDQTRSVHAVVNLTGPLSNLDETEVFVSCFSTAYRATRFAHSSVQFG